MPRFVLLYHDCPTGYVRASHWDLMFEANDVLETWALAHLPQGCEAAHTQTVLRFPACPPLSADDAVAAERLAAHRLAYLNFEGTLTGNRGEVVRVVAGEYAIESRSDEGWVVAIDEGLLRGEITLDRSAGGGQLWLLTYRRRRRRAAGAIT
jgi:hypothetical protein